jgi:DNA repair exonuclease SbcCD nuclease subunit
LKHNDINIIFFSDTHLGFDYPLRPRVNKRRRGEDFFRNFQIVLSYAIDNKCDLVIHGGDLFFRSKVPEPIVDRVYHALIKFVEHQIPIFIVPGNHERSRLPTSIFLNHPLIHVFDRPKVFSFKVKKARICIGGFPFIRGDINGEFLSTLKQSGWYRQKSNIKILALHQAIEGAIVSPGRFTFRKGLDVVSLSMLPNDATVILCGHIHRRQILKKTNGDFFPPIPVIFSGSTERTSFAEKEETKGFYHLVFNDKQDNKWTLEEQQFIELPTRPMTDIFIDSDFSTQQFESYLVKVINQIDQDSIIRFKSNKPINGKLKDLLTTKNLNQWLTPNLNFTISSRFFHEEK